MLKEFPATVLISVKNSFEQHFYLFRIKARAESVNIDPNNLNRKFVKHEEQKLTLSRKYIGYGTCHNWSFTVSVSGASAQVLFDQ